MNRKIIIFAALVVSVALLSCSSVALPVQIGTAEAHTYRHHYWHYSNQQSSSTATSTSVQITTTPVTTAPATTNVVPINNLQQPIKWELTYGTGPQIIHLDSTVTYNNQASIRIDRHTITDINSAREINSDGISAKPGQHIVFTCWMKTTESGYGDTNPYSGARIGIDFYRNGQRIGSVQSPTYPDTDQGVRINYVNWGTSQWTQRTIDFTVPQTISGQTPSGMILWMQVWSSTYGSTDPGHAWFANAQLYINP